MAKLSIVKGATSVLVRVFIQDSSSTTGAGLTGLAYNTASLVCYRMRDDDGNAGATAISLATATKGTWASGGFVEKDATNAPGWYEFGVPNAALSSGSRSVSIHLKGATNMAPCPIEIELTGVDNQDSVRGGMTALPNTACTTNASLITSGTGTDQLAVTSGKVDAGKINGVSAGSVTTISANLGTTQPVNFHGTGSSAYVKSDIEEILAVTAPTDAFGRLLVNNNITWSGTAQGGGSNYITLDTGASSVDDTYKGQTVRIKSNTGAGQAGFCTSYVGATRRLYIDRTWTAPDNTSTFDILATGTSQTGDAYAKVANLTLDGDNCVKADANKIGASASAATLLSSSAATIVSGTVSNAAFSPTNTEFESASITDSEGNLYKDRLLIFTSGGIAKEVCQITAYSLSSGKGHFTVTSLTSAPSNSDAFLII